MNTRCERWELFLLKKTYTISDSSALRYKLWIALIILCGVFLIWAYDASFSSIFIAIVVILCVFWRSGYIVHSITLQENGEIEVTTLLKTIDIFAGDINSIIENSYYREVAVFHRGGEDLLFHLM